MQREDASGQPRAAHMQQSKNLPDEQRIADVQRQVHELVAQRVELPDRILDAKARVDQRKILRARRKWRKPYLAKSVRRTQQRICGDVIIIVPDEPAAQRRQIGADRHHQDRQGAAGQQNSAARVG